MTILPVLLTLSLAADVNLARMDGVLALADSEHRDRWGLDGYHADAVRDGRTGTGAADSWMSDNWEVTHTVILVFPRRVDARQVRIHWGGPAPVKSRLEVWRGGSWVAAGAVPSGDAPVSDIAGTGIEALRLVQPADGAGAGADRRLAVAELEVLGQPAEPAVAVDAPALAARFAEELRAQRLREDQERTAPTIAVAMSPAKTTGLRGIVGPDDLARARHNVATYAWAKQYAERVVKDADWWAARPDDELWRLIPEGNPRALCPSFEYGCPIHGGARQSFTATLEAPYRWKCKRGGEVWFDGCQAKNPGTGETVTVHDDGHGWVAPAGFAHPGRRYYFIAAYRYYLLGKLFSGPYEGDGGSAYQGETPILQLALAHAITGDTKYAHKAAVLLSRLAQLYPGYDGCVEGPSQRQDGYLGQGFEPFLMDNVLLALDLIWDTLNGDQTLRRLLAASRPDPAAVATDDPRLNLQRNLLAPVYEWLHRLMPYMDGDFIMYEMTTLAALARVLDNPVIATEALDSDLGLRVLLQNSWFRDGKFIYDSTGYNVGNARTPLLIAEWLHGMRLPGRDRPLDLYHDPDYRMGMLYDFLREVDCDGRVPQIGDVGGARSVVLRTTPPFGTDEERALLRLPELRDVYLPQALAASGGDLSKGRLGHADWWLLFKAEDPPPPAAPPSLPPPASHLFEDSGIAILHAGANAATRQHVAMTFSKGSYAHGHPDKLAINLFRYGYDFSADLGYPTTWTDPKGRGWETNTASHCLVMLDGQGQTGNVIGRLGFFATDSLVDVVEASAEPAYPKSTLYRRTVALVRDNRGEPLYTVDLFRVAGAKQRDYLFHSLGKAEDMTVETAPGVTWTKQAKGSLAGADVAPMSQPGYGFLFDVQRARTDGGVTATWRIGSGQSQPDRYLLTRETYARATVEFTMTRTGRAGGQQERAVFVFGMDPAAPNDRRVLMLPADTLPVGKAVAVKIVLDAGQAQMTLDGKPTGSVNVVGSPPVKGAFGFLHYYNYGWEYRDLVITPAGGAPKPIDLSRPLDATTWARIDPTYEAADGILRVSDAQPASLTLRAVGAPGREVIRAVAEGYGLRGQSPLEGHLILRDTCADPAQGTVFVTVIEAHTGAPRVKAVERLTITPDGGGADAVALRVTTDAGQDLILSALDGSMPRTLTVGGHPIHFQGQFGLARMPLGQPDTSEWLVLVGSGRLMAGDGSVSRQPLWRGVVAGVAPPDVVVARAAERPAAGVRIRFDRPGYLTGAVYTVTAVEPAGAGLWRLRLDLPLTLARGVIASVDDAAGAFATRTPVMKLRVNPGLFDRKVVLALPDGKPHRLTTATEAAFVLEDRTTLAEFKPGGEYAVLDVGEGDTAEALPSAS